VLINRATICLKILCRYFVLILGRNPKNFSLMNFIA
jgi:hypothetical protein